MLEVEVGAIDAAAHQAREDVLEVAGADGDRGEQAGGGEAQGLGHGIPGSGAGATDGVPGIWRRPATKASAPGRVV